MCCLICVPKRFCHLHLFFVHGCDFRYGFVTNTKIKIIVMIDSMNSLMRDNEIRAVS